MPIAPLTGTGAPSIDASMIDEARRSGFTSQAAVREPKQEMDSEMFMTLLVSQLTNQDPSSPMDTNQMVSQSTELASMEQLTSMAGAQRDLLELQSHMFFADQRGTASELIGKVVTTDGFDAEPATGIVTAVTFPPEGEPMVSIDEELHPLSSIAAVGAVDSDSDQ